MKYEIKELPNYEIAKIESFRTKQKTKGVFEND